MERHIISGWFYRVINFDTIEATKAHALNNVIKNRR